VHPAPVGLQERSCAGCKQPGAERFVVELAFGVLVDDEVTDRSIVGCDFTAWPLCAREDCLESVGRFAAELRPRIDGRRTGAAMAAADTWLATVSDGTKIVRELAVGGG